MSINRRRFLQTTTSATTALMLSSLDVFASPQSTRNMDTNFQLKVLATKWGFKGTIDEFCAKVKQDGYDGFEIQWPGEKKYQEEMFIGVISYLGFNFSLPRGTLRRRNNFYIISRPVMLPI